MPTPTPDPTNRPAPGAPPRPAPEPDAARLLDEAEALFLVATALANSPSLQHILDTACAAVADALNADAAAVSLQRESPGGPSLHTRAAIDLPGAVGDAPLVSADDAAMFDGVLHGGVLHIADLRADPRVDRASAAAHAGLASLLAVPLRFRSGPVGVLQVFTREPRRFSDFEARLLRTIGDLLGAAVRGDGLEHTRRQHRQVQRQLAMAAQVQQRMLPRTPALPGYQLAARHVPSLELAGDFYDFIKLHDNLGITIGDVVGKGIPASLLMASVRASLRAYAHETYELRDIVRKVNDALCRDTRDDEFTTLFYGVLNPSTGRLTYCNAGHEPALLFRAATRRVETLTTGGMIVGTLPRLRFDQAVVDLAPGDAVLLFTDGLHEATNFDDEAYGRARVADAFAATAAQALDDPEADAGTLLNHVLWEKRRFTGVRQPNDDTTLVVLRRNHA